MPHPNNTPIAKMTCGAEEPTKSAQCLTRNVSFIFYCAPRDDKHQNPMYTVMYGKDLDHIGITDSAPYLTFLPYVVVDADTGRIIYPYDNAKDKLPQFQAPALSSIWRDGVRKMHALPTINIPDSVQRIALHIANDANPKNRKFQLFPWTVPNTAHSKVHVCEIRTDLQEKFSAENQLGGSPKENTIAPRPGADDEYFCYLNGDLWLSLSHEFTDNDIKELCPSEKLSRPVHQKALRKPTQTSETSNKDGKSESNPIHQTVSVDWTAALQTIYSLGKNSRSLDGFSVQIPILDITLKFAARAFANAINTSAKTTVQQALRRTSPRAFAAILKAAWCTNIDTVYLSSSWRPMLGSKLHKMGVGLDVTEIVDSAENIDFPVHNHGAIDRKSPFPDTPAGQKLSRLYTELNNNQQVTRLGVHTPWVNWVEPHDSHMHITVNYD